MISLLVSALIILVSAPIAYKVRFLDIGGTVAASILGIVVGVFLGPLMLFLGLNSAFTRVGYVSKALKGAAEPKGGARTWQSVVANGLPATLFSVAGHFFHPELYVVGFLSSIAVASADTSATELGLALQGFQHRSGHIILSRGVQWGRRLKVMFERRMSLCLVLNSIFVLLRCYTICSY